MRVLSRSWPRTKRAAKVTRSQQAPPAGLRCPQLHPYAEGKWPEPGARGRGVSMTTTSGGPGWGLLGRMRARAGRGPSSRVAGAACSQFREPR